jgi:NAD-dependent deacetylase
MIFSRKMIERFRRAKSLVVITGAGISAESGIPTFRGADGLWRRYRAEDLATPQAFQRDPRLVWEWYDWRRRLISEKEPNAGHVAIAAMEGLFEEFLLITQNVDGLHRKAGSRKLIEIHGNLWRVRCMGEGTVSSNNEVPLKEIPPRCECGALLRPDVVWFGESLSEKDLADSHMALRMRLAVGGWNIRRRPTGSIIPHHSPKWRGLHWRDQCGANAHFRMGR